MKQFLGTSILFLIAFNFLFFTAKAQNQSPELTYLSSFGELNTPMIKTYLDYIGAVAHNKSARKIEKRRKVSTALKLTYCEQSKLTHLKVVN